MSDRVRSRMESRVVLKDGYHVFHFPHAIEFHDGQLILSLLIHDERTLDDVIAHFERHRMKMRETSGPARLDIHGGDGAA